jgi:CheY-like chemotaxis protein
VERKAGEPTGAREQMKHVLVLDQDPAVAGAVVDLLRTHGLAVERAQTELEAFQRLSSLPTVRTVVIAGRSGAGGPVAHFARRVIPGVVVITLCSEASRAVFSEALLSA